MNSLIFIKTDVKSRFSGATPPWALRRIFEMGSYEKGEATQDIEV